MSQGKRLKDAKGKIDPAKTYPVAEAITLLKDVPKIKFDASVDIHVNLGIDASKSDQMVRSTVNLPHGTGKKIRVAAFVTDDQAAAAKAAGADMVGGDELINEIKKTEKTDFDVAVATPSMMKNLSAVARILGQKGLMPNPKTGTIAPDVSKVIKELKQGRVSYKSDGGGTVHVSIGKISFDAAKLEENAKSLLDSVKKAKPTTMKGNYLKTIYLSTTMGPSVRINL